VPILPLVTVNEFEGRVPVVRSAYIATVFMALLAAPALAQTPSAGTTTRVVGTVDKLDGDKLVVDTRSGPAVTVVLADNATIFGVEKRTLADIKPGDFLASGGSRAPTARFMLSRSGFSQKRCAAPARANDRGMSSRTVS
jgi:hypothetical protein